MAERVRLRERRASDESFLYSSWLKGFRASPSQKGVSNSIYFDRQQGVIQRILDRDSVRVLVLCNEEDEDQIYGWVCWEELGRNRVLHFVYVKHFARGNGFMRMMLREMGRVEDGESPYFWTSHYPASGELGGWFEGCGFVYDPDLVNYIRR